MLRLQEPAAAEMLKMFSDTTLVGWALQMIVGGLIIYVAFQSARELLNWANQQSEVWDWAEKQRRHGRSPERMQLRVQVEGKGATWSWTEWAQATSRPGLRRNPLFTALGRSSAIALFAVSVLAGIAWTQSMVKFLSGP